MIRSDSRKRLRHQIPIATAAIGVLLALGLVAGNARAQGPFIHDGVSIHPACVHAITMDSGDKIPVVRSVSIQGCMASDRAKSKTFRDGDRYGFEDETLLGEASFTYNHLSTLSNGLFILGIARIQPDGNEQFSLAAVQIVERPTLAAREVVKRKNLEMIGEVWIKDLQAASLRTSGNVVSYAAGIGPSRVEQTIDLSRIGKASR